MVVALARPRVPRGDLPDPTKGIDILLTLDYSRSMAEHDYHLEGKRTSRRDALLHVVESFVSKRPKDRIGIVCFARSPFLVSPLTLDHAPQDLLIGWTADGSDLRSHIELRELLSFTSSLELATEEPCTLYGTGTTATCVANIYASAVGITAEPGTQFYYGSNHMQVAGLMTMRRPGR